MPNPSGGGQLPKMGIQAMDILPPRAKSLDAWDCGFNIEPTNAKMHPDTNLLPSECTDLLLTRDHTDYKEIYDTTLFSVNGLLYKSLLHDRGITLQGAYDPYSDNLVNLLRFHELGLLKYTSLNEDTLIHDTNHAMRNCFYIEVDHPVKDMEIILSLGGYIHINNNAITIIGEHTLRVDTKRLPTLYRYSASRNISLYDTLDVPMNGDYSYDQLYFHSDTNLYNYFTAGNSFVSLIDSKKINIIKSEMADHGLPGRYYASDLITSPLIYESGEIAHYRNAGNRLHSHIECQSMRSYTPRAESTDMINDNWTTIAPPTLYEKHRYTRLWCYDISLLNQ